MFAAAYDNWVAMGVGAMLLLLMVAVLIAPERF